MYTYTHKNTTTNHEANRMAAVKNKHHMDCEASGLENAYSRPLSGRGF